MCWAQATPSSTAGVCHCTHLSNMSSSGWLLYWLSSTPDWGLQFLSPCIQISCIPQVEHHEPEEQMLFCLGNVTYLLDVTPSNPCTATPIVTNSFNLNYSSSKIWLLSNIQQCAVSPSPTSLNTTCSDPHTQWAWEGTITGGNPARREGVPDLQGGRVGGGGEEVAERPWRRDWEGNGHDRGRPYSPSMYSVALVTVSVAFLCLSCVVGSWFPHWPWALHCQNKHVHEYLDANPCVLRSACW